MTPSAVARWAATAIVALVLLAAPLIAVAATAQVTIRNFQFQPQSVTVNVGDTVTWTNNEPATQHTTTSDTGVWNSGSLSPGDRFSFTFASAGTFAYHCSIHTFMTGTVVVRAVATPPPTAPPPPATPAPTRQPTAPPPVATPAPTIAPTPTPEPPASVAPSPSPSPSSSPTARASPTIVAAASPATTRAPTAALPEDGPAAALIAGVLVGVAVFGALAWMLLRRR